MNIEYMKPDDLIPYEMNAKLHPADQVEHIANSIKMFGWTQPIVVDENNVVVIGHGRLMAAKELMLDKVPVVRRDDLTEEQINACRLADNKTNESPWDFGKLEEELAQLAIDGIDMEQFGFEVGEDFIDHSEVVEDEAPEVQEDAIAKLGQIYQLGDHRLMCGDSTDAETVSKLMNGARVDMVFTDPPYGMNLDTDYSSMVNRLDFAQGKNIKNGKKYNQGKVDEFHPEMISAVLSIDSQEVFLWGANYYAEILPDRNNGSWIVWDKRSTSETSEENAESADKMYGSCFELCWSKKAHKQDIARIKWAGVFGTEQEFDHKRYHPTQKPVKLSDWFISRYSEPGDIVADLFGGSGSTLIACEQTGRKCYMMELDPHYVDVIIKRWENLTGKKAVLLNDTE